MSTVLHHPRPVRGDSIRKQVALPRTSSRLPQYDNGRPTTPVHRAQLSEASTSSSMSSGLSFSLSSRGSLAETAYTSEGEYDDDDEGPFNCGEDYSVLDDLYDVHNATPVSPPRTDSKPLANQAAEPVDFARLLQQARLACDDAQDADLANDNLDACFCGQPREDDSIYCSRECSRADSLNALEGRSSTASSARNSIVSLSSTNDGASVMSGRSSSSSSAASHYRRVTEEERRRAEAERERERVAKEERVARAGSWRKKVQNADDEPSTSRHLPPRTSSKRAMHKATPTKPRSTSDTLQLAPAMAPSRHNDSTHHQPFPSSPQATLCPPSPVGSRHVGPDATPRACMPSSPSAATPRRGWGCRRADEDEDGVPSLADLQAEEEQRWAASHAHDRPANEQHDASSFGSGQLGLMMLQRDEDVEEDDDDDEQQDYVASFEPQRQHGRAGGAGAGHTRGKLSYQDLMGILSS